MTDNVLLILGATSDIGGEIARRLAPGRHVLLAARRPAACATLVDELRSLGAASVHTALFDATKLSDQVDVVKQAQQLGHLEHAVVCFGVLGDHDRALDDPQHALEIATVDYSAQVSMLLLLARTMRNQSAPSRIYAFSSIAGWRARRANFIYGSTKAGLDAFCQGLMDEVHGSSVSVTLARPGFVIGSMTKGMRPAPLSVTPDVVADAVTTPRTGSATIWIPRPLQILAWMMAIVPRPVWRHMPR
ncbi:SDR family oxidoreductase [Staphylococcus chromogenes]|nr:SDR family oxidoreductase [Staphylococcus chromogenes]